LAYLVGFLALDYSPDAHYIYIILYIMSCYCKTGVFNSYNRQGSKINKIVINMPSLVLDENIPHPIILLKLHFVL